MMDALACLFCIVFILGSVVLSLLILAGIWWREKSGESQFQVVVLGDAGRSPRMQYHCLSLVQLNYNVDLVAYGGNYVAQWFKRLLLIVLHSCKHTYNLAKKTARIGLFRNSFFSCVYMFHLLHSPFKCMYCKLLSSLKILDAKMGKERLLQYSVGLVHVPPWFLAMLVNHLRSTITTRAVTWWKNGWLIHWVYTMGNQWHSLCWY